MLSCQLARDLQSTCPMFLSYLLAKQSLGVTDLGFCARGRNLEVITKSGAD